MPTIEFKFGIGDRAMFGTRKATVAEAKINAAGAWYRLHYGDDEPGALWLREDQLTAVSPEPKFKVGQFVYSRFRSDPRAITKVEFLSTKPKDWPDAMWNGDGWYYSRDTGGVCFIESTLTPCEPEPPKPKEWKNGNKFKIGASDTKAKTVIAVHGDEVLYRSSSTGYDPVYSCPISMLREAAE